MGHPPVLTSSNPLSTLLQRSLALASLDRACRDLVPTFPQRSPPRLLTAAACGGSAPDCRTQRALLHLSYNCAIGMWTGDARDTRPRLADMWTHSVVAGRKAASTRSKVAGL